MQFVCVFCRSIVCGNAMSCICVLFMCMLMFMTEVGGGFEHIRNVLFLCSVSFFIVFGLFCSRSSCSVLFRSVVIERQEQNIRLRVFSVHAQMRSHVTILSQVVISSNTFA